MRGPSMKFGMPGTLAPWPSSTTSGTCGPVVAVHGNIDDGLQCGREAPKDMSIPPRGSDPILDDPHWRGCQDVCPMPSGPASPRTIAPYFHLRPFAHLARRPRPFWCSMLSIPGPPVTMDSITCAPCCALTSVRRASRISWSLNWVSAAPSRPSRRTYFRKRSAD